MSMLDRIKSKYDSVMESSNRVTFDEEEAENEVIIECASFFSELDALTVNGTDIESRRSIDVLNIGFDDDVELGAFEVSATDGRILDIPADVLVHSESYEYMKSYEDFYNEAYEDRPRTDMGNNDEIINQNAVKMYKEYLTKVYQEGLFSASKVSLDDPTVQWYRTIDFGPSDPNDPASRPYVVRLPIGYIAKNGKDILVKQRDTVNVMIDPYPDQFKLFGAKYIEQLTERGYKVPEGKSVWDVVIPKRIIVPEQPIDQFIFLIEAENVLSDKPDNDYLYMGYSVPISALKKKGSTNVSPSELNAKTISLFTTPGAKRTIVDGKAVIRESVYPTPIPERLVQEAISFGGDDGGDSSGNDNNNGGNDTPPEINGGGDTSSSSSSDNNGGGDAISADTGNSETSDTPPVEGDNKEAKEDANDVSGDIANKVEEETDKEKDEGDGDLGSLDNSLTDTPEDSDLEGENLDLGSDVSSDEGSIDDKLNDLNAEGEADADGMGEKVDVSDMSMNDLLQHAEEKLKNMSISDLQAFINNDDSATGVGESAVFQQEAFVLTKKNINAELDATIRNCLGVLNDSKLGMDDIIKGFKKDGKKLNRALSKASKMTDVYSDDERNKMIKCNKCLADLIIILKPDASKSEFQTIKRMIKSFVSQVKGISVIVDKHKNDNISDDTSSKKSDSKKTDDKKKSDKKTFSREVE